MPSSLWGYRRAQGGGGAASLMFPLGGGGVITSTFLFSHQGSILRSSCVFGGRIWQQCWCIVAQMRLLPARQCIPPRIIHDT